MPKLPQILDEENTLAKPKHILKTKVCQHQNKMWNEVLVKWKHYFVDEVTWKNEVEFKANFPNFVIKDNDLFLKGE